MEGAWERPHTYDFDGTLRFLRLGSNDPSFIRRPGEVFTALFTPDGPAVLRLVDGSRLTAQAWGPGAERAVEAAPNWLGLNDTPVTLGHLHPAVRELERRHPGLPLMLSPSPDAVRAQSAAALQSTGMLPKMARCMIDCARRAKRLDALADKSLDEFVRLVQVLPGVGPWTAGQLAGFHLAHPDAVCMGDYGLPHSIAYVLTGRERSNDAEMLELLEPFRPHRFRIVRLIMHAGIVPPRRGPRGDLKTRR
jgi:hypothetical protein